MAMGQNPNRTPSEHPNPTTKIGSLKWVVNSPIPPKMGSPLTVLTPTAISVLVGEYRPPRSPHASLMSWPKRLKKPTTLSKTGSGDRHGPSSAARCGPEQTHILPPIYVCVCVSKWWRPQNGWLPFGFLLKMFYFDGRHEKFSPPVEEAS